MDLKKQKPPIRVVVFGGGSVLEPDFKQFLLRLESHHAIALTGVFCQSPGRSLAAVARDLRHRRGLLLAGPLLVLLALRRIRPWLVHPRETRRMQCGLRTIDSRVHTVPDIHSESVLEHVRAQIADLGLVYGSPILKPVLFEIPRLGTLGIHHGLAPRYRGKKTTFWAMANNEPEAGVVIQRISAGLDTGCIVRSGTVPIGRRRYGAVLKDVLTLGLTLYIEAIESVHAGVAVFTPQQGEKGPLYRDPAARDLARFWFRRFRKSTPSS